MEFLTIDAFSIILAKLSDKGKLSLLTCSKEMMTALEKYALFNEPVDINAILYSQLFHCFTNIIVGEYLYYTSQKTVGFHNQPLILPKNVRTIKIDDNYSRSIDNCIPSTVTRL